MTKIEKYTKDYEDALFALIAAEGGEWSEYLGNNKQKYVDALAKSETYLIFEKNELAGYARCVNDFDLYVMDVLVDKNHRGKFLGQKLMSFVYETYNDKNAFVLAAENVLPFYSKLGYNAVGTLYQMTEKK